MKNKKTGLILSFKKTSWKTKGLLGSTVLFLVSGLLTWIDFRFSFRINGWTWIMLPANSSALMILLFWIESHFGTQKASAKPLLEKINKVLSLTVLFCVLGFMIYYHASFTLFSIGFYLGLLSAVAMVGFAFADRWFYRKS